MSADILHAQIQNFFRGGGGPGPMARKQSGQRFVFVFLVLNLFYSLQRGSNGFITEKTIPFYRSRGGPIFSRGSNFFQGGGGVQMLISIDTHITCDFPGGGGGRPPIPLLDPHM